MRLNSPSRQYCGSQLSLLLTAPTLGSGEIKPAKEDASANLGKACRQSSAQIVTSDLGRREKSGEQRSGKGLFALKRKAA
ncbi:hypothetical protein [Labrenzia sp. DG1229]|uniref:hypothetical protein n=1 Tax=Labrenzia sp. DG1229 TaxID=681847 RepID=UPI00048EBA3B|nr:hypothetical protein [Labrenzia sp. DG1229]